jgi:excisionase family DNA binding protein
LGTVNRRLVRSFVDIAPEPSTLTIEECAGILRLSRGSTYEAARRGEIPVIRIGRRLLVPRARLMALLGEDASSTQSTELEGE